MAYVTMMRTELISAAASWDTLCFFKYFVYLALLFQSVGRYIDIEGHHIIIMYKKFGPV